MSDIYFGDPLTYLKGDLLAKQAQGQVYENQARGLAVTQAMDAMSRMAAYRTGLANLTGVGVGPSAPAIPNSGGDGEPGYLAELATNGGGTAPNGAVQPSATSPSLMNTATNPTPKQSDMALADRNSAYQLYQLALKTGIPEEVDKAQKRVESATTRYDSSLAAEHKEKAEQAADFAKVLHDGVDNPIALNAGLKNLMLRSSDPQGLQQAIHNAGIPYDPTTDSFLWNPTVNDRLKALAPAALTAQQQAEAAHKAAELQETKRIHDAEIQRKADETRQKDVDNRIAQGRLAVEQQRAAAETKMLGLDLTNKVSSEIQTNLNNNDLRKNYDKFAVADKFARDLSTTIDATPKVGRGADQRVLNPVQSQQLVDMFENTSSLWRNRMGGGGEQEDVKELSGRLQKMSNYMLTVGQGQSIPVSAAREVIQNIKDIHQDVTASVYASEAKAVQAALARDPTGNAVKGLQLTVLDNKNTLKDLITNGKAQVNEFWPGTKTPKSITIQGQRIEFDKPVKAGDL